MASRLTAIGGEVPTNGAIETLEASTPYVATVAITGVVDILFHAWNCESVEAKGKAAKGSQAKKTDDVNSYVYRTAEGLLAIPGNYLTGSIVNAAKFRPDPRSPRKSAMDLFKAGISSLTVLASLNRKDWDYLDRRRVTIGKSAVTRTRPALLPGWQAEFQLLVNLPEYITPDVLSDVLTVAGKLIGLGDFRPTYGRFRLSRFSVGLDS